MLLKIVYKIMQVVYAINVLIKLQCNLVYENKIYSNNAFKKNMQNYKSPKI